MHSVRATRVRVKRYANVIHAHVPYRTPTHCTTQRSLCFFALLPDFWLASLLALLFLPSPTHEAQVDRQEKPIEGEFLASLAFDFLCSSILLVIL